MKGLSVSLSGSMSCGPGLTTYCASKLGFGRGMIGGGVERGRFAVASYFRGQVFCSVLDVVKQPLKMDENFLT